MQPGRKKMKSIRLKLWTGMMALVLIVLVLLWLFQIVFLESFYTNMRISDIKNKAISIINQQTSTNASDIQDKLETFAYNNNLSIEVFNLKGESKFLAGNTSGNMQMPMMRNSARIEAINEALKGNSVSLPVTHPRFGNKFMMLGISAATADSVSEAIAIGMPLAAVDETVAILKWQLVYISIILLFASVIISYLLSKSFTRPILDIKKATDRMALGDFSVRIENVKEDEIGELSGKVNYLGQQLSKIDQLRKDLIANVSHELRTPLSLIRGYAETIRDVTGGDSEKRTKQLGIIIEETDRLSKIVDDILNLSQLQSGYVKLNKSQFSVNEILDKISKNYEVLQEKTGIKLNFDIKNDIMLYADRARIEQVFFNLINNAFTHTKEGGSVTVRVIEKTGKVRFEIIDTGSGIPSEDLPFIWDRYYKADKTSGKKTVGTGLGLAIVKGVLEAHKASYGVESTVNSGTTFWFEIYNEASTR
jgi:signal transduction histidine kinase